MSSTKGIYNKKTIKISRSYLYSRLEKEYLAKSYELLVPIVKLEIQGDLNQVNFYGNNKINKRGLLC